MPLKEGYHGSEKKEWEIGGRRRTPCKQTGCPDTEAKDATGDSLFTSAENNEKLDDHVEDWLTEAIELSRLLNWQFECAKTEKARQRIRAEQSLITCDIAWEFLERGQNKQGLSLYRSLTVKEAGEVKYLGMGRAYVQLERYEDAKKVLFAGLKKYPESDPLHNCLGNCCLSQGNNMKASEYFAKAIQLDPHEDVYRFGFANACFNLGLYEDAAAIYRRLADENASLPNFKADINAQLGFCYLNVGNPEEALKCFLESSRINPDFPDTYTGLSCAYHDLGMRSDAIEVARAGIKKFPDFDRNLYHNLAVAYCEMNWSDEARDILKKGLKVFPGDEDLTSFLNELDSADGEDRDDKPSIKPLIFILGCHQKTDYVRKG